MKKIAVLAALSLLALLIVLPSTSSVNPTAGNPVLNNGTLSSDGMPGPPLPPKTKLHRDSTSLVADGMPGPPLPPKTQLHRDSAATSVSA